MAKSALGLNSGTEKVWTKVPQRSGKGPDFGPWSGFFLWDLCDIRILMKWLGKGLDLAKKSGILPL